MRRNGRMAHMDMVWFVRCIGCLIWLLFEGLRLSFVCNADKVLLFACVHVVAHMTLSADYHIIIKQLREISVIVCFISDWDGYMESGKRRECLCMLRRSFYVMLSTPICSGPLRFDDLRLLVSLRWIARGRRWCN